MSVSKNYFSSLKIGKENMLGLEQIKVKLPLYNIVLWLFPWMNPHH